MKGANYLRDEDAVDMVCAYCPDCHAELAHVFEREWWTSLGDPMEDERRLESHVVECVNGCGKFLLADATEALRSVKE